MKHLARLALCLAVLVSLTLARPIAAGGAATADLMATPTYRYNYFVLVETINGVRYPEEKIGRRAAGYSAAWSDADKQTAIRPATVSAAWATEDGYLILSGWAQVNGGQGKHYWSVDGQAWHRCQRGEFSAATAAMTERATSEGGITNAVAASAAFCDLTADLSAYVGQSVTVHFGISPANDPTQILHYLTVSTVSIPTSDTIVPMELATEPQTSAVSEVISEVGTGESGEIPTEPPTTAVVVFDTTAPADPSTTADTTMPIVASNGTDTAPGATSRGCASTLGGTVALVGTLIGAAGLACFRRRE